MLNLHAPVVTTWPTLGPPPRTVRARRKALLLIAGVPAGVLVFAALVLRTGNQELARLEQIVTDGHETSAQLTGRYSRGLTTSTSFVVARYRVGQQWYSAAFESKPLFETARQNQMVTVSYARADPSIVELGTRDEVSKKRGRASARLWLAPALLLTLSVAFSLVKWILLKQDLSLARDGILRWATVTDARTGSKSAAVKVSVDDSLGRVESTVSTSLEFATYQPVGSTAAVLSAPADLSRIRLCEEVMSSVVVDPADAS
jgi:hypothetical protein